MKKVLFVIVLVGIAIFSNGISSKEALNSYSLSIDVIQSEIYQFHGTVNWNGNEGVVLFFCPEGSYPGSLQLRQYPRDFISVSHFADRIFKISINKDYWESYGKPSSISFALFHGYSYWGEVGLEFTN